MFLMRAQASAAWSAHSPAASLGKPARQASGASTQLRGFRAAATGNPHGVGQPNTAPALG
jgi:hypothetical protein